MNEKVCLQVVLLIASSLTSMRVAANENLGRKRYAVLVAGVCNTQERYFWEDVLSMYNTIKECNFDRVLLLTPDGLDPDDKPNNIIDYPAEDFTNVLSSLTPLMDEDDLLFLWAYSHGGVDVGDDVYIVMGRMGLTDDRFTEALSQFKCNIVVGVESCFSGGFLDDLSGPKRIVMTSTFEEDESYFDFTDRMASALALNNKWADTDRNGYVSVYEAFEYVSSELFLYDDNGDGVFTSQDGQLGSHTYLELVKAIRTDLNCDGKVDIYDIMMVARIFSVEEGEKNWDSRMDLDNNGVINIIDIWMVAKEHGKTI
jgi:hypothetical protein